MQNLVNSTPPEYDNLYLDMNGIIHTCSQEITGSGVLSFSEEDLIRKVCNYVDKLFHIIRPTKLFYMAIDGVAPRSKLNQQRQRRFLSVFLENKAKEQMVKDGKEVPEVIFSRAAITPGTDFMYNLSESLQFFIKKKISEDLSWREVEIIFSGPENPGEGEHKIIDYIRKNKASPDWDPNQSHCIYGLDADLILLALVTHEPHFSILREEVSFKPTKRKLDFQMLHVSLLREYLDLEMRNDALEFGYDLECIIDDFIMIMIIFGNDFVPHLPFCEISNNGLNHVMQIYKDLLPDLGGYLTDSAQIDLDRLQLFLNKIAVYEQKQQNLSGDDDDDVDDLSSDEDSASLESERQAIDNIKQHFSDMDFADEEKEDDAQQAWKNAYYRQYFDDFPENFDEMAEFKHGLLQSYLEGLLWVLNYYHHGCISWRWFYPYYFAPLACDFTDLSSFEFNFEPGTPVTPYQQLMSVLPPQSAYLLPAAYRPLMVDENSPIADFYPKTFEVDTRDSHYFDGIAMIGFPDLQRLLDATANEDTYELTPKERMRNTLRQAWIIYHDAELEEDVESPNRKLFDDLIRSSANMEEVVLPELNEHSLKPFRLCDGVLCGPNSPSGFPTFGSIDFDWEYMHGHTNVWGSVSRRESIVIHPPLPVESSLIALKSLIGKKCYVNWPYHIEAKIIGFSDCNQHITADNTIEYMAVQKISYMEDIKKIPMDYLRSGMNVRDLIQSTVLVHVVRLVGVDAEVGGRKVKRYNDKIEHFPLQLMVAYDKVKADSRYEESEELPFEKRFPIGKQVIYINQDNFGAIGTVLHHYDQMLELELKVSSLDMEFGHQCASREVEDYYTLQVVAKELGLTTVQISLLTGALFVDKPTADIGLNMKYTGRQQQLMGYCRGTTMNDKNGNSFKRWEYSSKAIELIKSYLEKFPIIHDILDLHSTDSSKKNVDYSSLIPDKAERAAFIAEIEEFMRETKIRQQRLVPCDTQSLKQETVTRIEKHYLEQSKKEKITVVAKAAPEFVIEPASYESIISLERHATSKAMQQQQQQQQQRNNNNSNAVNSPLLMSNHNHAKQLANFQMAEKPKIFNMGDRVVTMLDKGNIPFGLYGTVVSVQDQKVDVILDQECFSGTNLDGTCSEKRGICISKTRLFNLSKPTANVNYRARRTKEPRVDSYEHWKKVQLEQNNNGRGAHLSVQQQQQQQQHNREDKMPPNLTWQQQEEFYRQQQRKNYYQRQEQYTKNFNKDELVVYGQKYPSVHTTHNNYHAHQQVQQQQQQQQQLHQQQPRQNNNKATAPPPGLSKQQAPANNNRPNKERKEKKPRSEVKQTEGASQLLQQMFESSPLPNPPASPPIASFFNKPPQPAAAAEESKPVEQPPPLMQMIQASLQSAQHQPQPQPPQHPAMFMHAPPPHPMYFPVPVPPVMAPMFPHLPNHGYPPAPGGPHPGAAAAGSAPQKNKPNKPQGKGAPQQHPRQPNMPQQQPRQPGNVHTLNDNRPKKQHVPQQPGNNNKEKYVKKPKPVGVAGAAPAEQKDQLNWQQKLPQAQPQVQPQEQQQHDQQQ
ncbi:hypothetical protein SAMD00019534_051230 [Acytostelium subglobosum LB1]|uniref:hypothetical protein n=1 Tax=Acytostelium subglobosum LB1 TaxID=1410327 RepID=UPI000644EEB3|nr:hypothetical protein SAMD00019534_051230 [Acytostelium subglobosum LB1]GAM21948.1 hypothetical protein SAMD00019534_051230 [Acytostelium subglobosum LB1]|eukprot:XP_012755048.1 hypothetical protein SAMD00019534_051230 [Acytostelium subglobosum LB1]